ncbi:MAG: GNVR domain-containing protein, partial [bacterium]
RLFQQRDALQQEISRLEPIYTPRHPDLISAKKALAKTEEEIRTVQKNFNSQPDTPSAIPPARAMAQLTPELSNLSRQLSANKPRLAALAEKERDLRERIEKYQARVESAPKREQQLLSLTRDYDNTRQNYKDLLNKKQSAQLSQNLEKRQEGEKFRVLDPANLPEKPYLPNRPKIILLGLVGGLGLGIGLVFLLESLFPAFHSLKSVQSSLDIPIIMAIPEIVIPGERKKNMIRLLLRAAAGAAVTAVVLFLLDRYVLDLTGVAVQIGKNIRSMRL